ncbi:MAG TPA: 50S ribosomal protein L25, partial [Gemmatimonadetes bacterium]|nr:50S ribosomal protein L25 [Gemmatimonadota bacterium]
MTITLKAQKREGTGKGVARKLRQEGRIPAVLYGRELGTMHLSLDTHEAENLFHSISTENTIVGLKVEGVGELFQTLVREIQSHPFKSSLIHVDFLRIQAGVAVDVEVPLRLVGDPIGVKNSGGVLEQVMNELPVKCIPSKIPELIEVDVSELDINESLHVY